MEDNRFDLEIRSMLENASESVPEGLWRGIESRLPAPARTRPAAIWWRVASAAGAVAAAVALTVFFSSRPVSVNPVEIIPSGQSTLSQAAIPEVRPSEGPLSQASEIPQPKLSGGMKPHSACAADASETGSGTADATDIAAGSANATDIAAESANATDIAAGTAVACGGQVDDAAVPETIAGANTPAERAVPEGEDIVNDEEQAGWLDKYEGSGFDETGKELRARSGERRGVGISAFSDALSNTNTTRNGKVSVQKRPVVPLATTITETSESRYAIPVAAGVGLRFDVCKRFSIGTGINWSYLTRSFSGQFNELDENGAIINQSSYTNIRNSQHYIGVPLNLYLDVVRKDFIDFYVYASGSANLCVSNRYRMDRTRSYTPEGGNWQFSAGVGMGVEFIAAGKVGFYIDPSLNYWFTTGEVSNIRTRQPLMLGLELGIRLHI